MVPFSLDKYRTDNTALLDGFVVSDGNSNSTSPNDRGGGLYNDIGSPIINHTTFTNNHAQYGGGIFNNNSSPTIRHSIIISNTVTAAGGGIYNFVGNPYFIHVEIIGNVASGLIASGGGMYNASNLVLIDTTFDHNVSVSSSSSWGIGGGGLYTGGNNNLLGVKFISVTVAQLEGGCFMGASLKIRNGA